MKFPFTKKEVHDILGEDKYIEIDYFFEKKKHKLIPVYTPVGSDLKDMGLVLEIRGGKSIGVSLNLRKRKIRGINHHERYHNPDGTVVRGWHEHIEEESKVEPVGRNFDDIDRLTEFALKKWNIKKLGTAGQQLLKFSRGGLKNDRKSLPEGSK